MGAALAVAWPLFRTRTHMLLAQSGVALFFGVHYILEGATTGAAMNALAFAQALIAIPLGARPGFRRAYLATLPLIAVALAATWSGAASVFAAVGFALISLGRYQLTAIRFRAFLALAVPCWMLHNWTVGSVPGLIADTCTLLTSAWMLRLDFVAARRLAVRVT
ncbi:Bacterial inner membrane protein [Planctomycetes bacterium Poly30]|uniref:Bacterial inner membrane protein n=2 Tax=Saltatorellus ferox TaxID=2528018 RepID=A0A518ELI0_9BACT|nr:Bacterial inner membrane protein [Planctomycetes bacterium Poly30]